MKKLRIGLLVLAGVLAAGLAFVLAHPREARRATAMSCVMRTSAAPVCEASRKRRSSDSAAGKRATA